MRTIVIFCLTLLSFKLVFGQLPCNSQLRLLYPHFFTHCDCHYSEWSEWVVDATTVMDVPTSQCPSGQALNEMRTRTAVGQDCSDRIETRKTCAPDQEDRLIMALGLGSSGQDTRSFQRQPENEFSDTGLADAVGWGGRRITVSIVEIPERVPTQSPTVPEPAPPGRRSVTTLPTHVIGFNVPACSSSKQICHHVTEPHSKRSLQEEDKFLEQVHFIPVLMPLENDPLPFEWGEHGRRFQRQVYRNCQPDGTQHILFMLDTSGSIGTHNFNRMTSKLSELVLLFCKPVKIAAMTFNHEYRVEFCFNCYDNTCDGRLKVSDAMCNIEYRGGWTHTGGAARCACDVLISASCGVNPAANCIDVVFVTDGRSNDPTRDVCEEIQCLHDRFGVNTYAIGIGSVRQDELDCITNTSNSMSVFNYKNFDEFEESLNTIVDRLMNQTQVSANYTCVDPDRTVGTQSC